MFESERFKIESQIVVTYLPFFGEIAKFPIAAAFIASVIVTVHITPALIGLFTIPYYLWVWTNQYIVAPAHFTAAVQRAEEITAGLRRLGFRFVTLDLQGFRSGSFDSPQP